MEWIYVEKNRSRKIASLREVGKKIPKQLHKSSTRAVLIEGDATIIVW